MKLNYKRTIVVGLGFFSICAFWQLYDHVVPLMLRYTFGIGDTVSGIVMALDNVLALFMLPLFGSLSDKTRTSWGRRMPYIACGSFAAAICMLLIPVADKLVMLPLFVCGLTLSLLCMATYRSPAVALMPDVTPRPLRSKGNAIINLMGAVGGIIILILVTIMLPKEAAIEGGTRPDYLPIYVCLMAIMVISTVVLLVVVKEPLWVKQMQDESAVYGIEETPAPKQSGAHEPPKALPPAVQRSMLFLLVSIVLWFFGYNAITTAFSKYCVEVFSIGAGGSAAVLMLAQTAAIISYIPVGTLSSKIGRKKMIQIGVAMLALAFGLGISSLVFQTLNWVMYLLFILAGIAWACINVNSYPMVVEMAGGGDVGRFTGYYYTASMAAQTFTPIVSGAALEHIGYWTLFPYATLFVGLSFVTMLFVHHGDARPAAPKSKLEAFEAMED